MKLQLDLRKAEGYKSKAQIARVLTEAWVQSNAYCPNCGQDCLDDFANNRPVADFYCAGCAEQFELKSKKGNPGKKIVDGAYGSMIERISSDDNPNFFFLTYDMQRYDVRNFLIIPKHFFTSRIIEKRKPLPLTAKRAGWEGCNIVIEAIPESGRIFYVKDRNIAIKADVLSQWQKTAFLRQATQKSRGWLLDVLDCLEKIPKKEFRLEEVYAFEEHLHALHPENNFVRDKIRQQLQFLRDKGYISFLSRGHYVKN